MQNPHEGTIWNQFPTLHNRELDQNITCTWERKVTQQYLTNK